MKVEERRSVRLVGAVFFWAGLLAASRAGALDWPQYRGPNHNGVSTETIRLDWATAPPRQVWKVPMDPALSSFSISGGKAFTQARRRVGGQDQEFCLALNADTGQELWATPLGIAFYPNGGVGSDDGPRSTPSVDGTRVYVFTSYLRLACLDAADGQIIWSKDFVAELGANVIDWQNAASPLIVGDLIYVNSNARNQRLMALRKEDGSVAWKGQDDAMTQASPIAATIAGVPQIVFFAQTGLVSVAPETGAVLWRFPMSYSTSTAASPVVGDDVVYCSAAYGVGSGAVRISNSGSAVTASQVWKARGAHMNHWATPVYHNGFLYGVYGQSLLSLRCIELATGTEKWQQSGVGYGSVLLVSGQLLVFTEDGDLVLVKPNPTAYQETARFKAVRGRCWNVPAISNGRIYARSTTEAASFDVAEAKPLSKLKLDPAQYEDGSFRFFIANDDGSPIDAARAARIDVFATSDLTVIPSAWTRLTIAPVLIDGRLRVEEASDATVQQRFYLTLERP